MATAILGVIFINFMGTAMSKSTRAVSNVEAEANAQALMEQIVSDYAVKINEGCPPPPRPTPWTTYLIKLRHFSHQKIYHLQSQRGSSGERVRYRHTENHRGVG